MRAADVVDGFRDLHTRITTNPTFARVVSFSADLDMHWPAGQDLAVQLLSRSEVECFQVGSNMVPLVQLAAESLDVTDTFRLDFAPAREGFVQFERPVTVVDLRGRTMNISWIRWGVAQPGTFWAIAFSDTSAPDEVSLTDLPDDRGLVESLGRWRYTGTTSTRDGAYLTLMDDQTRAYVRAVKDGESPAGPARPASASNDHQMLRLLKALWLLMAQQVGEVSTRELDRSAAKRARRLSLPTSVTVVELRRPAGHGDPTGAGRDFAVRWIVKGHFAWRACSAEHALAEPYEKGWRARVWIGSYVKNADRDDLPWAMGTKVVQLVR